MCLAAQEKNPEWCGEEICKSGVQVVLSRRSQTGPAPSGSRGWGLVRRVRTEFWESLDQASTAALHLPVGGSALSLPWEGEATGCTGCAVLENAPHLFELGFPPLWNEDNNPSHAFPAGFLPKSDESWIWKSFVNCKVHAQREVFREVLEKQKCVAPPSVVLRTSKVFPGKTGPHLPTSLVSQAPREAQRELDLQRGMTHCQTLKRLLLEECLLQQRQMF